MATLQVTAWQLWGTHHKTGSMEHNQDTDAPVPADELLESPAILTRFLAAPFALRHSVLVFRPQFIRRPLFSPPISKSRADQPGTTITTDCGQFAAFGGRPRTVRRVRSAARHRQASTRRLLNGRGSGGYLSAIFPSARAARPSAHKATPKRHITYAGNGNRARSVVGSDTKKPGWCSRARQFAAGDDVTSPRQPYRIGSRTACKLRARDRHRARPAWSLRPRSFRRSS